MMPDTSDRCSLCGVEMDGGLWTNGDGYGDAKYVDIERPPMRGFCWNCVKTRGAEIPNLGKQIQEAFASRNWCGFLIAWIGRCRELKPCSKHAALFCVSCHAPATHECGETGQFVCGAPLCEECEHTVFPSGTNGGVGFNAQPLPDGMQRHCRKTEQKFTPWYAAESAEENRTQAP